MYLGVSVVVEDFEKLEVIRKRWVVFCLWGYDLYFFCFVKMFLFIWLIIILGLEKSLKFSLYISIGLICDVFGVLFCFGMWK